MSNPFGLLGGQGGVGAGGGLLGQQAVTAYAQQQHNQAMMQGYQGQTPKNYRARELAPSCLNGLMAREASYMFTYAELAKEAFDLAEAMATEEKKRGY